MQLTYKDLDFIRDLRKRGFAVVTISAEKLEGVEAHKLEDQILELIQEVIDDNKRRWR